MSTIFLQNTLLTSRRAGGNYNRVLCKTVNEIPNNNTIPF